jgi:hypothetical protein
VPETYATNRAGPLPSLPSKPAPNQLEDVQEQPDQILPFYYIDEPSNTRKQLYVNQDTPYLKLTADLKTVSANVSFNLTEGRWLARIVNPTNAKMPAKGNGISRSHWFIISENVFRGMKKRIQEGTVGSIEIEHTLQYARDTGVEWILRGGKWNKGVRREERAPPPAPAPAYVPPYQGPVVWRLASQPSNAVERPAFANGAPRGLYPQPVPAFLRRLDDVERRPPPLPTTLSPLLAPVLAPAPSPSPTPLLPPRRTASAPASLWCASPPPAGA